MNKERIVGHQYSVKNKSFFFFQNPLLCALIYASKLILECLQFKCAI